MNDGHGLGRCWWLRNKSKAIFTRERRFKGSLLTQYTTAIKQKQKRESDFNKNLHSHFYHFNNIVIAIFLWVVREYTQNTFYP